MKSLLSLLRAFLDDVKRLMPEAHGLDRDYLTIKHRVEHEGLSFLAKTLPSLCDAFEEGLSTGVFTCPTSFKKAGKGALPSLLRGLLCEVFDDAGVIRELPNPEYVKVFRELTRFFKKLDLGSKSAEKLDKLAKANFVVDDASCISSISTVDARKLYIFDYVTSFVLDSIKSLDVREIRCKNGPGAVSEGYTTNGKWKALACYSPDLEYYGFDIFYLSRSMNQDHSFKDVHGDVSCRLVTVPKTSTSRRTITIEPLVKQFVQQGFNTILRNGIRKCPILSSCLTLDDQTANQRLAESGSISGKWATIDLKSASDLLSLSLVKRTFANHQALLDGLLSCRSSECDIDGTSITLQKYAGMGNATTFPVQSIVFALISICAILDDGKRITRNRIRKASTMLRVYGDDIIVPSPCAQRTIDWLHAFGLRVNVRKSFLSGYFRESCGVDAYKGVNVTPVYLRKLPVSADCVDANALASCISTSNQLWERCYYKTATVLQSLVENALGRALPLVRKNSGALGWHTRLDATSISKWNRRLHRFEYPAFFIQPKYRRDKISGYPALLKFLVSTDARSSQSDIDTVDIKHLERSSKRFQTRIARRFTPSW